MRTTDRTSQGIPCIANMDGFRKSHCQVGIDRDVRRVVARVCTGDWGKTSAGQECNGEAVLRGAGTSAVKSAALLLVSIQPLLARNVAMVLLRVGAAPLPSKKFALPYPTTY